MPMLIGLKGAASYDDKIRVHSTQKRGPTTASTATRQKAARDAGVSGAKMTDNDINKSVRQKVKDIFAELAPDSAKSVTGNRLAKNIIFRIKAIFSEDYGDRKASTLGMHMSDWNRDAAFIVALHLYPERFTDEEIRAGIQLFLAHAPNHIRAACQITDQYVWENFPETEPDEWEKAP